MPDFIAFPKAARDTLTQRAAMTTSYPTNPSQEDDQDTENMTCEFLLLGGASLAATYIAAGGDISMLSLPGAMLGAVVALLKATQEKRQWTDKGIVVIGASVIGTTVPSAAVHLLWPHWLEKLTWHVFFLAGFMLSIVGWMLIWPFILALDARRERIAKRAVDELERRWGVGGAGTKPEDNAVRTQNHREDEPR